MLPWWTLVSGVCLNVVCRSVKKALKDEWHKRDQNTLNKTLKSWLKCCMIYTTVICLILSIWYNKWSSGIKLFNVFFLLKYKLGTCRTCFFSIKTILVSRKIAIPAADFSNIHNAEAKVFFHYPMIHCLPQNFVLVRLLLKYPTKNYNPTT